MPAVNPKLLVWARETAGLSFEEAAEKLGIPTTKDAPAGEKLRAYESGTTIPSRSLLLKMAAQYRRPLLAFYMSEPPRLGDRGSDFRTLPDKYSSNELALVDALLRNVTARQSMVRATLEEEDEAAPLEFIGSHDINDGASAVASSVRRLLGIGAEEIYSQRSPEAAFSYLREQVEANHVFVLLIGNLGSYHTAISVEAFRGFAIADDIAPFIVINDQDSKPAWSFTLLHEFVHLILGQTGVSGVKGEAAVERFCNDVASEVLLPAHQLKEIELSKDLDVQSTTDRIHQFARRRNLSSSMVAYRLYRSGVIEHDRWSTVTDIFRDHWLKSRALAREKEREQEGGPNYYVIRRHRLGSALVGFVGRMLSAGALSTTRAGTILGVRPQNVHTVISPGAKLDGRAA